MALTVLPMREEDLPTFVRIELEAFRPHPRIPMLWPRGYTDDLYAYYEDNKGESFQDDNSRFMKAVDNESGAIVAASEWTFALDPVANASKLPTDPSEYPPANWPQGGNWALRTFFKIAWEKWRQEVMAGKPYIVLDILVVNPEQQGRGAGGKLLAWGCDQADKHGARMCLESTPAGLKLYKRLGFELVQVVNADMKQFGWNEPYEEDTAKRFYMVREPRVLT